MVPTWAELLHTTRTVTLVFCIFLFCMKFFRRGKKSVFFALCDNIYEATSAVAWSHLELFTERVNELADTPIVTNARGSGGASVVLSCWLCVALVFQCVRWWSALTRPGRTASTLWTTDWSCTTRPTTPTMEDSDVCPLACKHMHTDARTCACEHNLHFTAVYPLHKCIHRVAHPPGSSMQTYRHIVFFLMFVCVFYFNLFT